MEAGSFKVYTLHVLRYDILKKVDATNVEGQCSVCLFWATVETLMCTMVDPLLLLIQKVHYEGMKTQHILVSGMNIMIIPFLQK